MPRMKFSYLITMIRTSPSRRRTLMSQSSTPSDKPRPASPSLRVAAGEQPDLVPQPNQFLGRIGDDPLRTPIQLRGAALVKRGDLRDSHRIFWLFTRICGSPLRSF